MATTDANGQVFYGPTDPVEPLQALFNGVSTAVSTKMSSETQVVRIANVAGRTAAVAARTTAGRAITAADPLLAWRADAPGLAKEEYTIDGTNWRATSPRIDVDGAANADAFFKASTVAITTNSNGDATYVFAQPFPNRLLTLQVTEATPTTQLGGFYLKFLTAFSDRTRFSVRAYTPSGVVPNVPISVAYLATGD